MNAMGRGTDDDDDDDNGDDDLGKGKDLIWLHESRSLKVYNRLLRHLG